MIVAKQYSKVSDDNQLRFGTQNKNDKVKIKIKKNYYRAKIKLKLTLNKSLLIRTSLDVTLICSKLWKREGAHGKMPRLPKPKIRHACCQKGMYNIIHLINACNNSVFPCKNSPRSKKAKGLKRDRSFKSQPPLKKHKARVK